MRGGDAGYAGYAGYADTDQYVMCNTWPWKGVGASTLPRILPFKRACVAQYLIGLLLDYAGATGASDHAAQGFIKLLRLHHTEHHPVPHSQHRRGLCTPTTTSHDI